MSKPGSSSQFNLKYSRVIRLTRFLCTAMRICFFARIKPIRDWGSSLLAASNKRLHDDAFRWEWSKTRWKSAAVNNRWFLENPCPVIQGIWSDAPTNQALKRLRPFARRRLMTSRPFLFAILARKPWLRLRFRLLGWKVLFIWLYSQMLKKFGINTGPGF